MFLKHQLATFPIRSRKQTIIINGKAAGVTTLLTFIYLELLNMKKQVLLLSPDLSIKEMIESKGSGLHSSRVYLPETVKQIEEVFGQIKKPFSKQQMEILKPIEYIIIDNIHYITYDYIKFMNMQLREATDSKLPFGGIITF